MTSGQSPYFSGPDTAVAPWELGLHHVLRGEAAEAAGMLGRLQGCWAGPGMAMGRRPEKSVTEGSIQR